MGKLFTFEFLAPCFDSEAPRNRRKTPDIDGMTFYGEVKFNFSQFGADENLRRTSPLQYCVKMCHIIGFYLQHAHSLDLIKMKVEFNQDEFDEIWLMNVRDLCVRKTRYVPSDSGSQLADYVLQRMEALKKQK